MWQGVFPTVTTKSAAGDRFDGFAGLGSLAFAVPAVGRVAGRVAALPGETVAIRRAPQRNRMAAAPAIRRRFRPLLDTAAFTCLAKRIRRAAVGKVVTDAPAARPELPGF